MGGKKPIGTNPTRGNCHISSRGGRIQRSIPSTVSESDQPSFPSSEIQEFSLFSNLGGTASSNNRLGGGSLLALPWLLTANNSLSSAIQTETFSSLSEVKESKDFSNQEPFNIAFFPDQSTNSNSVGSKLVSSDMSNIIAAISRIEDEIVKINEHILSSSSVFNDNNRLNERLSTLEGRQGAIQSKGALFHPS
jgi:hypothetical protein